MTTENSQKIDLTEKEKLKFTEWPAYIDHDLMYEIESDCQDRTHGVNRRVLLATLTMDGEKMFKACEKEPEAFFDGFRASASTLGMLKRLVKLMDIGHNRLMLALCGVDFNQPDAPFSKQEFFDAIGEAKAEDEEKKDAQGGAS